MKTYPCPFCGYELEATESLDEPGATPVAGNVQICMRCAAPAVFTGDELHTRLPTEDEWATFHKDLGVAKTRAGVIQVRYIS